MLKQASVKQVREQSLPRANTAIVVCMCFYPRGIRKEWRDDYRSELAPDRELFQEWKKYEKTDGHDGAFKLSHYEERFQLTELALRYLKYYVEESRQKDVYLVCQCNIGEKCHREMLMLTAQKKFSAPIDKIHNDYKIFSARLSEDPTKI
jgi:uncharacterized protein YeaO (DUF488 family)